MFLHPPSFKIVSLDDSYSPGSPPRYRTIVNSYNPSFVMPGERGTKKQYDGTLRRWGEFCHTWQIHPITPHVNDVVEFLSFLYDNGGKVWCNRPLLIVPWEIFYIFQGCLCWPTTPLIQKVVKGAYNTRPPAPCYVVIWDTDTLLHYLDSLDNTFN